MHGSQGRMAQAMGAYRAARVSFENNLIQSTIYEFRRRVGFLKHDEK